MQIEASLLGKVVLGEIILGEDMGQFAFPSEVRSSRTSSVALRPAGPSTATSKLSRLERVHDRYSERGRVNSCVVLAEEPG